MILGAPGMGKTTLAVLLLRELLQHAEPDEPVPILLTLSDWDADTEPFHTWLTRRLGEAYPALRTIEFGADAPSTLVAGRHILPVLDGLDELPEPVRVKAIAALNAELTATDQLILTCRTEEYIAVVTAHAGDVLTGGAVIEPVPLKASDAVAYLERCLPPGRAGWPRLLGQLKAAPQGELARALGTPLTLWLLRKVYVDGHREPSGLANSERFPTADSIAEHLLDRLVQTAIAGHPSRSDSGEVQLFRPRHRWDPGKAERWLGFLANRLVSRGDYDYVWWRRYGSSPGLLQYLYMPLREEPRRTKALSATFDQPGKSPAVQTPASAVRRDLLTTVALVPLFILRMSLGFGLTTLATLLDAPDSLSSSIPAFVLFFAYGILLFARDRPSLAYLLSGVVLRIRGRIPLRLMAFLEDMHRLGILRQVGPVYQFRHAKLQDRLAETYRSARMS